MVLGGWKFELNSHDLIWCEKYSIISNSRTLPSYGSITVDLIGWTRNSHDYGSVTPHLTSRGNSLTSSIVYGHPQARNYVIWAIPYAYGTLRWAGSRHQIKNLFIRWSVQDGGLMGWGSWKMWCELSNIWADGIYWLENAGSISYKVSFWADVVWILGWKMGLDRIMNEQKVLCGWGENQEAWCKFTGDEV
jgi:hypothetical protein